MKHDEVKELADALEGVERRVGRLVYELRADPAEAERHRLSTLLGRAANRMFSGHDPVYPSNLLDVISAWLGGYELGHGHADIEKAFRDAVALADRPVPSPPLEPK